GGKLAVWASGKRVPSEAGDGTRELAGEALAVNHPAAERQRDLDVRIVAGVGLGQALREASADRAKLVEQHRLGDALELDAHGLGDVFERADPVAGRGGHEDLAGARGTPHARREVERGADHPALRAL